MELTNQQLLEIARRLRPYTEAALKFAIYFLERHPNDFNAREFLEEADIGKESIDFILDWYKKEEEDEYEDAQDANRHEMDLDEARLLDYHERKGF